MEVEREMPKNLKRILGAAFILTAMTTAGLAEPTYEEEQADCEGDALRLCGPVIPDHEKIRACLVEYQAYLTPACRAIVAPQRSEETR
ncbi:MAG: hypothetical protein WDN46_07945 [Methylocella sp.]